MRDSYEGCEPLVDDDRLGQAIVTVMARKPSKWWDYVFATGGIATAINPDMEPRREASGLVVDDQQFQIVAVADSPSRALKPLRIRQPVAITASGWMAGWRESERERGHFVSPRPDPLIGFVDVVTTALFTKLDDLEQIDPPKS
jgi:hypothetical protein